VNPRITPKVAGEGIQPWMVGVQADVTSAEERDRFRHLLNTAVSDRTCTIVLSTCHRVELYGFGAIPKLDSDLRVEMGGAAVRHLLRVAAGLESAIIGEDEVLHQVRAALAEARATRPVDNRLARMFETAIAAGRRARAGRASSGGNLAQRAVAWLQQQAPLRGRHVLIAGAGRMGSALAHAAKVAGSEVTIASRNPKRAGTLALVYGGRGVDLEAGARLAPKSAAIAVALAGEWHQFHPTGTDLPPIADISAPPAVPSSVRARLNGGFLGVDDLYARADSVPGGFIQRTEPIVEAKANEFMTWLGGRS
jgi:glutamyl-tRNA reductase